VEQGKNDIDTAQDHKAILDLERGFWLGDTGFYLGNLASRAMMVFPDPIGLMTREQILDSIEHAPRWTVIEIAGVRFLELGGDTVLVSYRARAKRPRQQFEYSVLASSLYVREQGRLKLAFHQHTPTMRTG
jgi:hypothetical protein